MDASALASLFERDSRDKLDLDRASQDILAATVQDAIGTAQLLKARLAAFHGELMPIAHRVAIQMLDALWRAGEGRDDRVQNVMDGRDWLAERFGEIPAVLLYRGAEMMLAGDRSGAFSHYREAANAIGETGLPRMYLGANSVHDADPGDWLAGEPKRPIATVPAIKWVKEPTEQGRGCILVGSDAPYFINFARALYDSIKGKDKRSQIHFHVVNWSADLDGILGRDDGLLSITSEPFKYERDYPYFAAVRFYRALEIMEKLGVPLYITDIDNRLRASLSDVVEELREYDAGFRNVINGDWFPWWGPSAGNTWLNCNDAGRQVARWMRDYIGVRFKVLSRGSAWWFDQLMLNEVRHQARLSGLRIADLSEMKFYVSSVRLAAETIALKTKG